MSVPVQRTTGVDLQKLVDQVPAWAEAKGLKPVAAVPVGEGRRVLLTGDEFDAEGFIDLAHTCGARVLYFESEVFVAQQFAVMDDDGLDEDGVSAEDQLSADDQNDRKRLRLTARAHDGKITEVETCVQDARLQADAEAERIAAELADNPEFRAATKRSHHHGIASGACPPPDGADDEELHEHQRIVRWATSQAIELVEEASRRIYAGYERDLEALADEITQQNVLTGATTAKARTLLVGEFLTAKAGGYPPPKRFMDLLMLRPQFPRPQKTQMAKAGLLPFD